MPLDPGLRLGAFVMEAGSAAARDLLDCDAVTAPGSTNCAPTFVQHTGLSLRWGFLSSSIKHTLRVEYDDWGVGTPDPGAVREFLSRNDSFVPYWQSNPPSRHRLHFGFPSSPAIVSKTNTHTHIYTG